MKSYKDTLNLPKTKFPMKANLPQREPEMVKFWQEINVYKKMHESKKNNPKFILNDGPPYANGDIHLGHALNKILKDIVNKSKNFSGYQTPYIPGWDCHGLPIEINVEKKFGKAGDKISAKEFRQKCAEYAASQVEKQKESFIRLGVIADWEHPYKTMDYSYEANVIRALAKIIENGHLHKGERPVHWCVSCGSSLAEAEVEYKDKQSPSIDILFKVAQKDNFLNCFLKANAESKNKFKNDLGTGDIYVVVWTTTPWTLPANEAVALEFDIDYVLVQIEGKRIFLARELLSPLMEKTGINNYKILNEAKGKYFDLQKLHHPFYGKIVPIILGDHVTLDAGTGCVHTAPAHGHDDYVIGLKYNLPVYSPVLANGYFANDVQYVGGLHFSKAQDEIIEILKNNSALFHYETISHSYPHCWRHKTPLIFRATPQWFIGMEQNNLRNLAIDAVRNKVKWIPEWGQARIETMIRNRPDWCISRQRAWGVPMSLFVHKETNDLHPKSVELMRKVADMVEKRGMDAWYELDKDEFLGNDSEFYEKINDVLEVWFDAGAVHYCVLDANKDLHSPADLYLEGSDQHRGWFQSSMLSSIAMKNEPPYKQVLTHGFTVDENGRKMSKSLGNVISPEKIMKTLGADIIRLWVASADYKQEPHLSDNILKRVSDAYRRIRNTARFLLSNLDDFYPQTDLLDPKDMVALDRWIINKTKSLQKEIIKEYEEYNFHVIYQLIHNFCVIELGSFYLDVIKDRQYTCQKQGKPRRSCQTAMYYLIEALVRWLAPILSFTAEEIYKNIPLANEDREESIFVTTWYDKFPEISESRIMNEEYWQEILKIRDSVNKVLEEKRTSGAIGSALVAEVDLYCSDELYEKLSLLKDELRFVLITSSAKIHPLKEAEKISDVIKIDDNLSVAVLASKHEKCERCWHRREDVNKDVNYPNICSRCVKNISSTEGEERLFA